MPSYTDYSDAISVLVSRLVAALACVPEWRACKPI